MPETIKLLQDQLLESNASSAMNFDTRTPPRVKQQQLTKLQETVQKAEAEKSHPGIAVPMDEESLLLDLQEDPKKFTFYKSGGEKPTTDSGISTWILLSGQNGPTTTIKSKVTPKPVTINKEEVFVEDVQNRKINSTAVVYEKPIKPIFKRRPAVSTTTKNPTISPVTKEVVPAKTTTDAKKVPSTTAAPTTTKMMKKASVVNSVPTGKNSTKKITTSTSKPKLAPEKKKPSTGPTEFVKVPIIKTANTTAVTDSNGTSIESNIISPEAKEGTLDLSTQATNKKTRRPTHKKKKNKRRKTKPTADDKIDTVVSSNSTKLSTKLKEKPFGTQIYNYLSREVMPTVGVGLVGLMVTAGLASYFLYPFGALRRSYDIDRKDKEGGIYYKDPYHMGGVAEEEMIGKVIAGMPALTSKNQQQTQKVDSGVNYNRIQGSRNTYPTTMSTFSQQQQRYRQVETKPHGTVESVELPYASANYQGNYQSSEISYVQNTPSVAQEEVQTYTEKQFVVGNIPKELEDAATPAVVPEHGPRRRKRRQVVAEDFDNEVDSHITKDGKEMSSTTSTETVVTSLDSNSRNSTSFEAPEIGTINQENSSPSVVTDENIYAVADKVQSILDLVKDLIFYKLKIGLEILQNKTISMSRYLTRVQDRIEKTYREG